MSYPIKNRTGTRKSKSAVTDWVVLPTGIVIPVEHYDEFFWGASNGSVGSESGGTTPRFRIRVLASIWGGPTTRVAHVQPSPFLLRMLMRAFRR